jgi:hypothetical protein
MAGGSDRYSSSFTESSLAWSVEWIGVGGKPATTHTDSITNIQYTLSQR